MDLPSGYLLLFCQSLSCGNTVKPERGAGKYIEQGRDKKSYRWFGGQEYEKKKHEHDYLKLFAFFDIQMFKTEIAMVAHH